jgi:hypothetical protein
MRATACRRIELNAHCAGRHTCTFLHAHFKHHAQRCPERRQWHHVPAASTLHTDELRRHAVHAVGTRTAIVVAFVTALLLWCASEVTPRRIDGRRGATSNLCETTAGWRWRWHESCHVAPALSLWIVAYGAVGQKPQLCLLGSVQFLQLPLQPIVERVDDAVRNKVHRRCHVPTMERLIVCEVAHRRLARILKTQRELAHVALLHTICIDLVDATRLIAHVRAFPDGKIDAGDLVRRVRWRRWY